MYKNPYTGKFVVLEGLDGAGKSTQAVSVAQSFKVQGKDCHMTSEPSQFLIGGLVRSRLLGAWQSSGECLQILFAADRADQLDKEIIPALRRGTNVVCDRYFLSSLAYGAIDSDREWLKQVNSRFLLPDLTVYLDVLPDECVRRLISNGKSIELFEKADILEKVRDNYFKIIEEFKNESEIAILDGSRPKEVVFKDIKERIDKILI